MVELNKRYDLRLPMQFTLWTRVYVQKKGRRTNIVSSEIRKKWGTSTLCRGAKWGPSPLWTRNKWATSTLCRDQDQNGATHHSEQVNWVTSTFYRDQEQNVAHRHSEHGKNGSHRHGVKTRNKMGPITTLNGGKWVTSTPCRDREQNGAHRQWAENSNKITKHFGTSDLAGIRTRDTQQVYRRKAWADNKTKNTEDTASHVDPPPSPDFTKEFFTVSTSHCFTFHVYM